MKVLSFGSLNFDHIYQMDHFVLPGETLAANGYQRGFGGKGLNQSIALAKAGMQVWHAGKVGFDGQPFIDYLNKYQVYTDYLIKEETIATGHAIIEVCNAQNRIVIHGGANQAITSAQIDQTLAHFDAGDYLLIQNEISNLPYLIRAAKAKGMLIFLNAAPMDEKVPAYPLELVDILCVNEIEGAGLVRMKYDSDHDTVSADSNIANLSESDTPEQLLDALKTCYPDLQILLTYGAQGSYYTGPKGNYYVPAKSVQAVDTTAAGDTYSGYFLAGISTGADVKQAMELATIAASMTVQKPGAADAIPGIDEVKGILQYEK